MINIKCEINKKTKSFKVIDLYSSVVIFSLLDVKIEDKRKCNFEIDDNDSISIDDITYPLSFTLNGVKRYENVFDIGTLFDTLKDLKNNRFEFNDGKEKTSKKNCITYRYKISDTSSPLDFEVYARVNKVKSELVSVTIKESNFSILSLSKEEFNSFCDNLTKFLEYIRFETIKRICFDKIFIRGKKLFAVQKNKQVIFSQGDSIEIVYKKENDIVRESNMTIKGFLSINKIHIEDIRGLVEIIDIDNILLINQHTHIKSKDDIISLSKNIFKYFIKGSSYYKTLFKTKSTSYLAYKELDIFCDRIVINYLNDYGYKPSYSLKYEIVKNIKGML